MSRLRLPRRLLAALLGGVSLATLTACASTVSLDPAADATNTSCAELMVRLPDLLGDDGRRETDAQSTAAWGDPASVLLHCGVAVPGPTTDACVTVDGIDWIQQEGKDEVYTFTTYGRDPATEVVIDSAAAAASTVLADLATPVGAITATGACVGPEDLAPTPTPTPTP